MTIDSITQNMVIMPVFGRIQFYTGKKAQSGLGCQQLCFFHIGHTVVIGYSEHANQFLY